MGRQSSRIYFNGQDHKEMVTWDGTKYQYHDKAYIWNGNAFELVWEKLPYDYDLWFVKDGDLEFYHQPFIIRNANGGIRYYIDWQGTTLIKVFDDGTKESINLGNIPHMGLGYTVDGYVLAIEYPQYQPFPKKVTLVNMNTMTIVKSQSVHHQNYTPPTTSQYIYCEGSYTTKWVHNLEIDSFRSTAIITYGTSINSHTYYIGTLTVDATIRNTTFDFWMHLGGKFTTQGGSLSGAGNHYLYDGYNEYCYPWHIGNPIENSTNTLAVFRTNLDMDEHTTTIVPAEYRYDYPIDRFRALKVNANTEACYKNISDTEYDLCLIDIQHMPFSGLKYMTLSDQNNIGVNLPFALDSDRRYLLLSCYDRRGAQSQFQGKNIVGKYDITTNKLKFIGAVGDTVYMATGNGNRNEHTFTTDHNHVIMYSENDSMWHKYRITSQRPTQS
jgi:hypothetical protein